GRVQLARELFGLEEAAVDPHADLAAGGADVRPLRRRGTGQ
ncbi:MAG: hypothetical protein QOC54_3199, partial [Baekduia sp.]|nr:hypothetical protein [Baekduia sp.]